MDEQINQTKPNGSCNSSTKFVIISSYRPQRGPGA